MARFAILEHDHPVLHWDFLLECGPVLWTWRLEAPPERGRGEVRAERIAEHRLLYLDYEGPVSGNRGSVRRWDAGTFDWLEKQEERVAVRLAGMKVAGVWELARVEGAGWSGRWVE
jgi:hypothetical protein